MNFRTYKTLGDTPRRPPLITQNGLLDPFGSTEFYKHSKRSFSLETLSENVRGCFQET